MAYLYFFYKPSNLFICIFSSSVQIWTCFSSRTYLQFLKPNPKLNLYVFTYIFSRFVRILKLNSSSFISLTKYVKVYFKTLLLSFLSMLLHLSTNISVRTFHYLKHHLRIFLPQAFLKLFSFMFVIKSVFFSKISPSFLNISI